MSQSANKYKGHKLDPRYKRLTMLDLINIMARGIRIRSQRYDEETQDQSHRHVLDHVCLNHG